MSPQASSSVFPLAPQTVAIPLLSSVSTKPESEASTLFRDKESRWVNATVASGILRLLFAPLIPLLGK